MNALRRPRSARVLALLLLVACGDDDSVIADGGGDGGAGDGGPPPLVAEGCNPIASEWHCLAPFPSDVFLVPDAAEASGQRVEIPESARLVTTRGESLDLYALHTADGFSRLPQIVAAMPFDVDDAPLVFHDEDVGATARGEGPTLLLDAETGAPILHFAEIDPRARDAADRSLVIRPMVRLRDGARYVVAIRDLMQADGSPVPAPRAFAAIRDGDDMAHPVLVPLAARYETDIFPVLEDAGVDRGSLVLAWDFTVSTIESPTRDMLAIRDDVMARLEAAPPAITIVDVMDIDVADDPHVARRIEGTMRVPLYLENGEPRARITRDAMGVPESRGDIDVPFRVLVPRSVAERDPTAPPARALVYGHGFFGTRDEMLADFLGQTIDRMGAVAFGVDWWGMSLPDRGPVATDLLDDTANALVFTDRLHQAFANQIALGYAIRGPLASAMELAVDASPLYDETHLYYYGNSNGYILGTTYVTLSPHVERAVFGVGGVGYTFMMFRAAPFGLFLGLVQMRMPRPIDHQLFVSMIGSEFDRIDPTTYTPRLLEGTLPGAPAERRVLLQYGPGDSAVPYLSAELHARILGIPLLTPSSRPVPELPTMDGDFDGSALVQLDYGLDPPIPGDLGQPPIDDPMIHEGIRRLDVAQQQIDLFLRPDGRVVATCEAACDPD